jgi:hypothetical protein
VYGVGEMSEEAQRHKTNRDKYPTVTNIFSRKGKELPLHAP